MNQIKIYIASPLSAPTNEEIKHNMQLASEHKQTAFDIFNTLRSNTEIRCFAPHSYLPNELNDNIPEERDIAVDFGNRILNLCDIIFMSTNNTGKISKGMAEEIKTAVKHHKPIYVATQIDAETLINYCNNLVYSENNIKPLIRYIHNIIHPYSHLFGATEQKPHFIIPELKSISKNTSIEYISATKNINIKCLNLSKRATNSLKCKEINTLQGLLDYIQNDIDNLYKINNIGYKTVSEIYAKLKEINCIDNDDNIINKPFIQLLNIARIRQFNY